MPLDVFNHHDRVVDHEPHREHDGEQREQIDGEAGRHHQEDGADQGDRNRHDRDDDRAHGAEEQEDDEDDDEERLREGLQDLVDGTLDVLRRIVRDAGLHPDGELRSDARHRLAHPPDHLQRIGGRKHPDAHEDGALAVEADVLLVVLGAQRDVRDVA